jgi:hypothetical protein
LSGKNGELSEIFVPLGSLVHIAANKKVAQVATRDSHGVCVYDWPVLMGVALGFRYSVFVLIPTIILAGVSTAVIEASRRALVYSFNCRVGRHDASN